MVFGGMAHPVVTWHKFVQVFLKFGINVHIVRLPGRFERLMEEPERDVKVVVDGVIKVGVDVVMSLQDPDLFSF
jgi:surfactin synthase thioesterase subunit